MAVQFSSMLTARQPLYFGRKHENPQDGSISEPSLGLQLSDGGRALCDLAAYLDNRNELLKKLPRATDETTHPVLVLTGYRGDDGLSTRALKELIKHLGYDVINEGPDFFGFPSLLSFLNINTPLNLFYSISYLTRVVKSTYQHTGKPVTLIGWSLGGMIDREIARRAPEAVNMVISLGSPFNTAHGGTSPLEDSPYALEARAVGTRGTMLDPQIAAHAHERLDVPFTSIYTLEDGIAPPELCMQYENDQPEDGPPHIAPFENIALKKGAHSGLPIRPEVLAIVADRLSQGIVKGEKADNWQPYDLASYPWLNQKNLSLAA